LPFIIGEGTIFEQGLTRDPIKDGDGALMLRAVKDQFSDVLACKLRRGLAQHGVVPCDFIRLGVFAFAIQLEDAMLDALAFIRGNTDEIDDCPRPAADQ
jgi:hypothetical protein